MRSFDSVRDLVADRVYQQRASSEMRKFLDRVRRQAIIDWKNEELRKAYERQVANLDRTILADPAEPALDGSRWPGRGSGRNGMRTHAFRLP